MFKLFFFLLFSLWLCSHARIRPIAVRLSRYHMTRGWAEWSLDRANSFASNYSKSSWIDLQAKSVCATFVWLALMIAALLQIIDNTTERENHTMCRLIINGVIFFSARRRLFYTFRKQTRRSDVSEGNRGTCCQGKWSLKKYICLMKKFRLHCLPRKNSKADGLGRSFSILETKASRARILTVCSQVRALFFVRGKKRKIAWEILAVALLQARRTMDALNYTCRWLRGSM